jgi:hypothetical protein
MSSTNSDQITDEALASSISDDGRLSSDAFDADEEGIVEAGIPPPAPDSVEGDALNEEAFSVDDFDADLSVNDSAEPTEPSGINEAANSPASQSDRPFNPEVTSVEPVEKQVASSPNGQVAEFRKTLSALSRQLEVDRLTFLYQQLQADGNELPSLERIASDIRGDDTLHALGDHDMYSKRPLSRLQGWISGLSFGLCRRAKKFSR